MKKLFILLLTFVLLCSIFVYAKPIKFAVCKRVIDGDTIVLENGTRVRLIGINSPESNERHYLTAFFDLKFKINGKIIRLEYDSVNEANNHLGKYGRLLAYVYLDDVFINEEIVKDGCARTYLKYPFDEKKQLLFLKAEKYARENQLGIWKPATKNNVTSIENLSEIDKLKLKAERGDVKAQVKLADNYYNGDNVLINYEKAAYWFQKAANQNDSYAQYSLGYCYEYGKGALKNSEKAAYWYKKAAVQGNADAQYKLGFFYNKGIGVPRDYKKASSWYMKAAEQGDEDAKKALEHLQSKKQRLEEPILWYMKALQQGDKDAKKTYELLLSEKRRRENPLKKGILALLVKVKWGVPSAIKKSQRFINKKAEMWFYENADGETEDRIYFEKGVVRKIQINEELSDH